MSFSRNHRCAWVSEDPLYKTYHDTEWGVSPHDDGALPSVYRNYRITGKSAMVRERVRREEKQQLLYLICDCSGSMKDGQRIAKAGGVIMNRIKAVVAGEAQIYVRFFDSRLYEGHFASTPAEAKELIRHFEAKNFSGGSTKIDVCASEAQKRMKLPKERSRALFCCPIVSSPLILLGSNIHQLRLTSHCTGLTGPVSIK